MSATEPRHPSGAVRQLAGLRLPALGLILLTVELADTDTQPAFDYLLIGGFVFSLLAIWLAFLSPRGDIVPWPVYAVIDLVMLSALTYTSGGDASPIAPLFIILPLAGVISYSPVYTAIVGAISLTSYVVVSALHAAIEGGGDASLTVRTSMFIVLGTAAAVLPVRAVVQRTRRLEEAERERLESDETRRRLEMLEVVNRELESFSQSVAHDLRSPLRAIEGFTTLLMAEHGDEFKGEALDYLARIRVGSERMSSLIDGLLELSRVGRDELHREAVDLSAVAREVAEELSVAEPGRPVEVEVQADLDTHADPDLSRLVVQNLMANAWKFTGGEKTAHVDFGATGNGAFFVRDNGAGFDMAQAARLFSPFGRLHRTSEFPGSGIGLASVKRVVERHGGRVWAEGAVGEGAIFYFTLERE